MKKILFLCLAFFALSACKTSKEATNVQRQTVTNLEGRTVMQETSEMSGVAKREALSENGKSIVDVPYKWFAGTAKADDKQFAITQAQREAYATITRTLLLYVKDEAAKGDLDNTGKVVMAAKNHWTQYSQAILTACEPFGDVVIQYDPSTQMYDVKAKVAIRGDRWNKLLEANAYNFSKNSTLSEEEIKKVIEINNNIIEAARIK